MVGFDLLVCVERLCDKNQNGIALVQLSVTRLGQVVFGQLGLAGVQPVAFGLFRQRQTGRRMLGLRTGHSQPKQNWEKKQTGMQIHGIV